MTRHPQIALLGGDRLHLQDGPIDLIIKADGHRDQVEAAYRAAVMRFDRLLDELCVELPELRRAASRSSAVQGVVAQRMLTAVMPFARADFITPMAAVAGAVAEEILGAMTKAADLDRAYVNNGGDIALHLRDGQSFSIGLIARPDAPALTGACTVTSHDHIRGVATSGAHGRSFSRGIADAVTVLARTASQADAAATIIGNAVDLPGHPAVVRRRACDIQPDNDLGERLVTRHVAALSSADIADALAAGLTCADDLLQRDLIEGAALQLQGRCETIGPTPSLIPPHHRRTRIAAHA